MNAKTRRVRAGWVGSETQKPAGLGRARGAILQRSISITVRLPLVKRIVTGMNSQSMGAGSADRRDGSGGTSQNTFCPTIKRRALLIRPGVPLVNADDTRSAAAHVVQYRLRNLESHAGALKACCHGSTHVVKRPRRHWTGQPVQPFLCLAEAARSRCTTVSTRSQSLIRGTARNRSAAAGTGRIRCAAVLRPVRRDRPCAQVRGQFRPRHPRHLAAPLACQQQQPEQPLPRLLEPLANLPNAPDLGIRQHPVAESSCDALGRDANGLDAGRRV